MFLDFLILTVLARKWRHKIDSKKEFPTYGVKTKNFKRTYRDELKCEKSICKA